MKNNKKIILAAIVILLIGALLVLIIKNKSNKQATEGLIKIKNYTYPDGGVTCQAFTPECGFCNGKVIDKQCYVTQKQLNEYRHMYSNLQTE